MSFVYNKARKAFENGQINWGSDSIKLALVSAGYTPSQTADQYYSDIVPASNVVGTPVALANKVTTVSSVDGVCSSDPVVITSVTGSQVTKLVLYKDTGTTTTSPLIAVFTTGTGLPVTPDGNNITVTPDATGGWFTL